MQLIKKPLLPILSLIVYIAYSYLLSSLFDFNPDDESLLLKIHFVDPLNFLSAFFSYNLISPALPILLVTLLFTLQRRPNLKNIGCIIIITTLAFIITKLLFFFIIPLRIIYLANIHSNTLFIALLMNRSMIHLLVFIICWAFCCHYIFTKVKEPDTTNTLSTKTIKRLITSFYSLFIVITFVSYLQYSVFKPSYTVETSLQGYLIIIVAISLFYLLTWTHEYLRQTPDTEHYQGNIIKAYSMTIGLHILLANGLFLTTILLKGFIHKHDEVKTLLMQSYWLWASLLIIFAITFIIIVAKQVNHIGYKITHYLIFLCLSCLILFIGNNIGSFKIVFIAYAIIMFFTACSAWINAQFVRLSITQFFRTKQPINVS
ncbi:hypothetical protein DM558_01845 [Entomomonas moraniae]|uniref:Uncharacterized protein n=1 Tax=Entomomonas moraniae TaxID=2213226 RepID=A0A3S9XAW8_9GAMM|nr:hypothetical protein [Entomomonas moraniae]AZS49593.1 hypothetical protein DM558_01845 [Entomomonas moraniae]